MPSTFISIIGGYFIKTDERDTLPARPYTEALKKCRLPVGNESSTSITLADGRKLGYAEYGAKSGHAIFFLHGLPGCRIDGAWFHAEAQELGLRILAVDRPGIGSSSPSPKRTISQHADDIRQLAERLSLGHYGVVGVSGGGPYALACAKLLPPAQLRAVMVCSGSGPVQAGRAGMQWRNRLGFYVVPYFPSVSRWFYASQPGGRLELSGDQRFVLFREKSSVLNMHAKDEAFYKDDDALVHHLRSCEEAFAHGYDGSAQDAALLFRKWDFRLEDVHYEVPIDLWYGTQDEQVPVQHGEYIAGKLGRKGRLHLIEDTHVGVIIRQRREWLQSMADSMRNAVQRS